MDDLSRPPSAEHPYGIAVCGTPITPGLVVFTNEFKTGTVVEGSMREHSPGWFDVEYADGRKVMQDPGRVSTRFRTYEGTWLYAKTEHDKAQKGATS